MKAPLISVVAPVYGVEGYIESFAASLFGQTYDKIQFIIVNDGTKDASIEKLQALLDRDFAHLKDRVLIINKENEGLPKARETGLAYVEGDYVLHVDSDDWLELDAIEQIAKEAERTDADLIYYDFYKEYSHRSKKDVERDYTAADKKKFIRNLYNYKAYGYVWNKCVKTKVYKENEVYFPLYAMHEDIYLMSQLIFYSKSITHLKSALYHYRRNISTSITRQNKKKRRQASVLNMLDLYERFKKKGIEGSPVEPMLGDIFYAAAWNSILFDLGLYEKFPYLASEVRALGVSPKYRLLLVLQIFVQLKGLLR